MHFFLPVLLLDPDENINAQFTTTKNENRINMYAQYVRFKKYDQLLAIEGVRMCDRKQNEQLIGKKCQ